MPRDGSGVYSRPPGTDAVADTTIDSAKYNNNVQDVEADLNAPRPVVAGGTAATSADAALTNLSAEKAKQVVTNWDSTTWRAGSFYAATSATGAAPVAGHAFAGVAYYANTSDFVNEAVDLTVPASPVKYIRVMAAGVWSTWTAIGVGAVRYDAAQTLTAAQKAQARANIDALKKNYVLNGAMQISQENGATAGTLQIAGPTSYYPADMFKTSIIGSSGVYTAQQVVSFTPSGAATRIRLTVTTADAAVAAGDTVWIDTAIEGLRSNDLRFGSAVAKTVTLQFGVKAPAGTYCVVLLNSATNRSYVAEYVIAAGEANTDVVKSIVIAGDTTGTWAQDNSAGLAIRWGLMAGTTFQQAAGSWGTGNVVGSPNQFNFMGTINNIFELFDVGLYEGSVAPAFQVPDYPSELRLCQRYWQRIAPGIRVYTTLASNYSYVYFNGIDMRASPTTAILVSGSSANAANFTVVQGAAGRFGEMTITLTSNAAGDAYLLDRVYSLNARL